MDTEASLRQTKPLSALLAMLSPTESVYSYEPQIRTYAIALGERCTQFSETQFLTEPSVVSYQLVSPSDRQLNLYSGGSQDLVAYTVTGNAILVEAKELPKVVGYVSNVSENAFLVGARGQVGLASNWGGMCRILSWGDTTFKWIEPTTTILGSVTDKLAYLAQYENRLSEDTVISLKGLITNLRDELRDWPGSYNQLLVSGSLDYCRSVLAKLSIAGSPLRSEIIKSVRDYYALCLGIVQQYREEKSTLRRVDLQSIQDRFDRLQETCATHGVYPRLEELEIADIPRD